jgi:hypothetical protein
MDILQFNHNALCPKGGERWGLSVPPKSRFVQFGGTSHRDIIESVMLQE